MGASSEEFIEESVASAEPSGSHVPSMQQEDSVGTGTSQTTSTSSHKKKRGTSSKGSAHDSRKEQGTPVDMNHGQHLLPQPTHATAEDSTASMDGKSGASAEITKRYLKLLNTGKLGSKEKHARVDGTVRRSIATMQPSAEGSDPKSVYEPDIARLRSTAKGLEVQPLQPRVPSAASSGGAGGGSPRRVTADVLSPRSASAPRSRPQASSTLPSSGLMYRRLYSPGPGAYTPVVDRHGGWDGAAFGFGTARQRPPHACIQEYAMSPGPVYLPSKHSLSTTCASPNYRFGKGSRGVKPDGSADLPSNHPHWNPGPGQYDMVALATGGTTEAGADVPKTVFGSATKLVSPQSNLSATTFLSEGHALKENVGVHSPGPAHYSPDRSPTQPSAAQHSLGVKAPSYFDVFLDPFRQLSPGPIYNPSTTDRRGNRTWGGSARATFGRGIKSWDPELNLSSTVFISNLHANVNQGIHSPGPVYAPTLKQHVPSPILASGQQDRFYDRFEPGRIL